MTSSIKQSGINAADLAILQALFPAKGSAAGVGTFAALTPKFESALRDGGALPQFQQTAATAPWALAAFADKGRVGRAYRDACTFFYSADGKKLVSRVSGDALDSAIAALMARWSAFFPDIAPRAKPQGETPTQKIGRLQAELFAVTLERDALVAKLASVTATAKAPAKAKAPEAVPA